MALDLGNNPEKNIAHRYVLPLTRLVLPPELILTKSRPRYLDLEETIVGKVEWKVAWFWSRTVEVVTASPQCNTEDGCDLEGQGGSVARVTWRF